MITLYVPADAPARQTMDGVQRVAGEHPGEHRLKLLVPKRRPPEGTRDWQHSHVTLMLGPEWGYSGTPECLEALAEFGDAAAVADG